MNKSKRLYFTCPIKALYMAKEFGVKFEFKTEEVYTKAERINNGIGHGFTSFEEHFNEASRSITYEECCHVESLLNWEKDDCWYFYIAKESESVFLRNKDEIVNGKHFLAAEVEDD